MEETAKQIVKPDHISYREYKKRLAKKPHQSLVIFVSTFFILLLAFLGMAKLVTPKVDIEIGDTPEVTYEQSGPEDVARGNIDDRLKKIQDEDNNFTGAVDSGFSYELDEKVKIPDKKAKASEPLQQHEEPPIVLDKKGDSLIPNSVKEQIKDIQSQKPQETHTEKAPVPSVEASVPPVAKSADFHSGAPVPAAPVRTYKVYVGNYDSAAQAEVAKTILAETGLGAASTFVKNVNGAYTLQVGSYSSQDKAFAAAADLLKNNFPARVVAE